MAKHKHAGKKVFTSPGSLIYVGKEVRESATIKLIEFNQNTIKEETFNNSKDFTRAKSEEGLVKWLTIDGLHDISVISAISEVFSLHPLLQEDILNTFQKPKFENFSDKYIFVIMKVLHLENDEISTEHIALVLGKGYVLSYQEKRIGENVFSSVESRLKTSVGKTRKGGADYLFYTLCDVIVDSYMVLLESFSELLEDLELQVIENPNANNQKRIYNLKKELLLIRKAVLPLREIFGNLAREDSPLIAEATHVYYRDTYDHVLQVLDSIEGYREMVENIQHIYLNNLSNKMNSIMKTLTVYTAIFMPLTFITGLYGMNFENMPELHDPHGYFYALGGMLVISAGMWIYFKWKNFF